MSAATHYLRVRIHNGMFSDERIVVYPPDHEGDRDHSFFVPADKVIGEPGTVGLLKVIGTYSRGINWAQLYDDGNLKVIPVKEGDLS